MNAENGMRPVHPGEALREELDELGLAPDALRRGARRPDQPGDGDPEG